MVHNNFHASYNEMSKVTCLSDGDGATLSEQKMYRYNFLVFSRASSTVVSNTAAHIAMSDTYDINTRVVRCLGQLPSMDVTGIMGCSDGECKLHIDFNYAQQ